MLIIIFRFCFCLFSSSASPSTITFTLTLSHSLTCLFWLCIHSNSWCCCCCYWCPLLLHRVAVVYRSMHLPFNQRLLVHLLHLTLMVPMTMMMMMLLLLSLLKLLILPHVIACDAWNVCATTRNQFKLIDWRRGIWMNSSKYWNRIVHYFALMHCYQRHKLFYSQAALKCTIPLCK